MIKVPIILLNYNSSSDCAKCISYLKRQRGVEIEIVVVDNCSQADDLTRLRALCQNEPLCTLIENHENRGYNAGNNIGLRYAAEKGYKYALIANPDMEFPQEDYVAKLVAKMEEDESVVVCGSDIVGVDGKHQSPKRFTTYHEELLWPLRALWRKISNKQIILNISSGYCDILMGSCILIRIDFMKDIGYFDENVFLFCEEVILAKQVESLGYKLYYFREALAIHAHVPSCKGSFVKRHDIYWKSRWYYLSNYTDYSSIQLVLLGFSKKVHYLFKRLQFVVCGIK